MSYSIRCSFADQTSSAEAPLPELVTDSFQILGEAIRKLITPSAQLFTKPSTFEGDLDFHVSDDLQIGFSDAREICEAVPMGGRGSRQADFNTASQNNWPVSEPSQRPEFPLTLG